MNVQLISVIMIILLGSFGIIGHGIMMLIEDNERDKLVAQLNRRIKDYNDNTVPMLNSTIVDIQGYGPMTLTAETIEFADTNAGVIPPEPVSYVWVIKTPRRHTYKGTAKRTSPADAPVTILDYPYIELVSHKKYETPCLKELAASTCGVSPCCSVDDLRSFCRVYSKTDFFNYTAYDGADQCLISSVCGACEWAGYIGTRCEMLQWHQGVWRAVPQDNNHSTGCAWPFTSDDHTLEKERPPDLTLKIRTQDDPWLFVNNETFGTMRLGPTSGENQRDAFLFIGSGTGVLLIGAGGIIAHSLNKSRIEELEKERNRTKKKKPKKSVEDGTTDGAPSDGAKAAGPTPQPPPPPGAPPGKGRFMPPPPAGSPPRGALAVPVAAAAGAGYARMAAGPSPPRRERSGVAYIDMGGRRNRPEREFGGSRMTPRPKSSVSSLTATPTASSLANFGAISRTSSLNSNFSLPSANASPLAHLPPATRSAGSTRAGSPGRRGGFHDL